MNEGKSKEAFRPQRPAGKSQAMAIRVRMRDSRNGESSYSRWREDVEGRWASCGPPSATGQVGEILACEVKALRCSDIPPCRA